MFTECLLGTLYSVCNVPNVIFSKTFYIHPNIFFFYGLSFFNELSGVNECL